MSFIDRIKRLLNGSSNGSGPDHPVAPEAGSDEGISCRDAITLINEFMDGELEDVSEAQVLTHFEVCKRCYPHLELEKSFRAALQRASAGCEGASPELKARIMDLLRAESPD